MRSVVLRFVFKGGDAIQTVSTEEQARKIIHLWKSGQFQGIQMDHTGWWAVDATHLAGIHWLELPPQQPQQQGNPWYGDKSGLRN